MLKHILITAEGFQKKKEELAQLESQREEAVKELQFAREQGDRSENGAYKAARWKLSSIDRRLRILKEIIRRSSVVERNKLDTVEIGAEVELRINDQIKVFQLVGSEESDIENNKLSHVSPIGKSITGKKKGESTIVATPGGILNVTILEIR